MSDRAAPGGVVPTKLRVPEPPAAGMVARPRLVERLLAASQPVVLITGPAGFGKTVVATDWLRRSAAPHAWLSLDELDNDPKRFLNHLAAAMDALGGDAAARVADVLRSLRGGADIARNAEFVEALQALDPASVLVLDDVHVLDGDPVLDLLAALLELRHSAPRLVLLSRMIPPISLARLRVSGDLLEVREQDLRFTTDEAMALFTALLPGGLDADLVQRLERRTEGWAAGLRMAAIALEHSEDRRSVVDAFTGSHRFVADYLLEEAVGRQPEAVQRFLMDTSVLARFTVDTCVAVTGEESARHLLQEVEAANLFVVPLGADRQWYRYHQLFAELLEFRLRRLNPERLDLLHERASRWYEENGDIASAFEHAGRMSSSARVAALLDRHALSLLARSELMSLLRWLRLVPDPLQQPYPTLLLSLGWLRTISERAPDLEPLLTAARAALAAGPAGYNEAALETTRLELEILRAYHARFSGRYEDALRIGAALLDELPADSVALRGRILFNQGRVYMTLGEPARAAVLLQRSIEDNLQAGTHYLVLTGLAQAAAILLETEGVPAARNSLEAAMRVAETRHLTRLPAYSVVLYHLAHVLTVADELDAAKPYLEGALALGVMGDMPDGTANALAGMARIHAAEGNFAEAERLLLELESLARTRNLGLMEVDPAIPRRRHNLYLAAAGHDVAIAPVAQPAAGEANASARWTIVDEARDLCTMLEALHGSTPDATAVALAAAARICSNSEPRGRRLAPCAARVVEALLGEESTRWTVLDAALSDAAARQYVRPLLEIGPRLEPLLQAALSQPLLRAARAHARLLLDKLRGAAPATLEVYRVADAAVVEAAPQLAAVSALTDRELEALQHLCRGLSNKAIARKMYVSPETVKTHLKHIFDKLEVSRRSEAVARARLLGMAPTLDA